MLFRIGIITLTGLISTSLIGRAIPLLSNHVERVTIELSESSSQLTPVEKGGDDSAVLVQHQEFKVDLIIFEEQVNVESLHESTEEIPVPPLHPFECDCPTPVCQSAVSQLTQSATSLISQRRESDFSRLTPGQVEDVDLVFRRWMEEIRLEAEALSKQYNLSCTHSELKFNLLPSNHPDSTAPSNHLEPFQAIEDMSAIPQSRDWGYVFDVVIGWAWETATGAL